MKTFEEFKQFASTIHGPDAMRALYDFMADDHRSTQDAQMRFLGKLNTELSVLKSIMFDLINKIPYPLNAVHRYRAEDGEGWMP